MDSQSQLFALSFDLPAAPSIGAGAPLPCRRPMRAQAIEVWTPVSFLGAAVTVLLSVPRLLVAPALLIRRRA